MRMQDYQNSCWNINEVLVRKLLQSCFFLPGSPGSRGGTGEATEPRTKTPQALESNGEANLGYRQLTVFQEEFRPFDPAGREIFMGRHSKDCLEPSQKMKRGKR